MYFAKFFLHKDIGFQNQIIAHEHDYKFALSRQKFCTVHFHIAFIEDTQKAKTLFTDR